MKQIIGTHAKIEHAARLHPIRIVVIILLAREWAVTTLRQHQKFGGHLSQRASRAHTVRNRIVDRGEYTIASEADCNLLVGRQAVGLRPPIRKAASHPTTVLAARLGDP